MAKDKQSGAPTAWTPYPKALVEFGKAGHAQIVIGEDIAEIDVETNVTWEADTARVSLDNARFQSDYLRKELPIRIWLGRVADPDRWAKQELVKIFSGRIDGVLPRFGKTRTVEIRARDLTRGLIDMEITESYVKSTASDQVAELARVARFDSKHLDLDVSGSEVGDKSFLRTSGWEAIQILGLREGAVAWVDRNEVLHFRKRARDDPRIATYHYLEKPFTILEADFDDTSVGIANRIRVVRYLDTRYIEGRAEDVDRIHKMGGRIVERTIYATDGKTKDDLNRQARNRLTENNRDVITGRLTVEGFPELVADAQIDVKGRLGRFKGLYYINSAAHRFSKSGGYTCELNVTNMRPEASEVYKDSLLDPEEKNPDSTNQSAKCFDSPTSSAALGPAAPGTPNTVQQIEGLPSTSTGTTFTAMGRRYYVAFGLRELYANGCLSENVCYHRGMDLWIGPNDGAPIRGHGEGEEVWAFQPGTVAYAGPAGKGGLGVGINQEDGTQGEYYHNSRALVKVGDAVQRGTPIAILGDTGDPGNPHSHYEVRSAGNFEYGDEQFHTINPMPYMVGGSGQSTSTVDAVSSDGAAATVLANVTRESAPTPGVNIQGTFASQPLGVILHGGRGGGLTISADYASTRNSGHTRVDGIGWNASIGEDVYAVHMGANQWGYNAGDESATYLGVEFGQPDIRDITDGQVRAFVAWFRRDVAASWPNLTLTATQTSLPAHSQLAQGIAAGKSDVFPANDRRLQELRDRILALLGDPTSVWRPKTGDCLPAGGNKNMSDPGNVGGAYFGRLSVEVRTAIWAAFGDLGAAVAEEAAIIASWESGGGIPENINPAVINNTRDPAGGCNIRLSNGHLSEYSVGIFQVNTCAHGTTYGSVAQLKDPEINAHGARALYDERISLGQWGWNAWGTKGHLQSQRSDV